MIEEQKGAIEAEVLLEALGFDSLPIIPIDIAHSIDCDNFKLVLEYQSFDSDAVLGKAEGNNKGALIYINENIPDSGRSNFTAAHEIGHVCMHIMPLRKLSFECGSKEINNPFDDPIEREANGFASGLLMPKGLLTKHSDGEVNWQNISIISELCKTSLEATYRRMSFLDSTPTALVIHKEGRFKRFVASPNFDYFINNSPLSTDQMSYAVDVTQDQYPANFEIVDACDWVNPYSQGIHLESINASTILLNEGYTYTVLSYDDDCIQQEDGND